MTKTNGEGMNGTRVMLLKFIPDTPHNRRVRDEGLRMTYDYAHAVMIDGVQRATWKKRHYSIGWELVDIDGDAIKQPRSNTYTDRATKLPKTRHFEAHVHVPAIDMAVKVTLEVMNEGLIPTPQEMKARRVKALRTANKTRLANHKVNVAQAKQDAAGALYDALSNIANSDHTLAHSARGIAHAALAKVKLPPEPDLKEAPGDPPGTWLVSAGRLYEVKGKKK